MDQNHLETLLEQIHGDVRLVAEGLDGVNQRLDRHDQRFDQMDRRFEQMELSFGKLTLRMDGMEASMGRMERRLGGVETRLDGVESTMAGVLADTRAIKRGMGVLQSIANDHESRIQGLENTTRDHLAGHS